MQQIFLWSPFTTCSYCHITNWATFANVTYFLIRAICFVEWAILFWRSHSWCFWASLPWGLFCTSEPKASLASHRSRVLHFNTTNYFKVMFSFPRRSILKCITLRGLHPAWVQDPGALKKPWKGLTFLLLPKDKGGSRRGSQGSPGAPFHRQVRPGFLPGSGPSSAVIAEKG